MQKETNFLNLKEFELVGRSPTRANFYQKKINKLTENEAMGLEKHFVPSRIDDMSDLFNELSKATKPELILLIESLEEPFYKRYVAGQILALIGDPRIDVFNPNMIPIGSYNGKLGLNKDEVDKVVEKYRDYGIIKEWIEKESPEYDVHLEPFRIAKYPVTNMEYLEFMKDTKHEEIPSSWNFGSYNPFYANHPVYTISSNSCIKYCEWLSQKIGRKFRLPTEAEWEFMAAGPERLEFPWGNKFLPDHCNTVETGIFQTTAVGTFGKGHSSFGCADVAGNVEEFVANYYKGYSSGKFVKDDLVAINGNYRVARGGSFTRFSDLARTRRRHGPNPSSIYVMGFRLAENY